MKPHFCLTAVSVVLLTACATVPTPISVQERLGQSLTYVRGVPCAEGVIELPDGPVMASICTEPSTSNRATVIVRVANQSSRPVTLNEGSVSATANGEVLDVLGHKELIAEEKSRQTWAAIAAGLAAAGDSMAAADAGYSSHTGYGTTSATAYGNGGYARVNAQTSYYGTTYDAGAAAAARDRADAKNAQMFDQLAARNQMAEAIIADALRTHTVPPGGAHGTYVALELPRRAKGVAAQAEVTLTIEGQVLRFGVNVGP